MTISVRQVKVAADNVVTLDNAPIEGNQLAVFFAERSGAETATISGVNWNERIEFPFNPTSTTFRKFLVAYEKVAEASEPSTITITPNVDTGSQCTIAIEFQSDSGETFTFEQAIQAGQDGDTASLSSGTTGSVATTNNLKVAFALLKSKTTAAVPWSTWTNGLTNAAAQDLGNNLMDAALAWGVDTSSGTKETTGSGDTYANGAIVGLLVFSIGGGGTNATVEATTVAATASVPAPVLEAGASTSPATIQNNSDIPAPDVQAGSSAEVSPAVVSTIASVLTASVEAGITISPALIAVITSIPAPEVKAGLEPDDYVYAWDIDEGTGTLLNEKVAGVEDLTLSGAHSWVAGPALSGQPSSDNAIDFTGGHAEDTSIVDPFPTNDLTIAILAKIDVNNENQTLINFGTDAISVHMQPWGDGNFYSGLELSGVFREADWIGYTFGTWNWYFLTITDNGANNTARLFLNGEATAKATSSTFTEDVPAVTRVCVGKNTGSGTADLNGQVAAIRIFDRVLTQSERAAMGKESTETSATVNAAVVAAIASVLAPEVSVGSEVSPSVTEAVSAIPAPTVEGGAGVSPATIITLSDVLAPDLATGSTVSPALIEALTSIPTPDVSAGGNASISPDVVSILTNVPAPTLEAGAGVNPSIIALVVNVPAPELQAGAEVSPTTVTAVVSIPAPTVVADTGATVEPEVVAVTVEIFTPDITADRWRQVLDVISETIWTRANE